MTQLADDNRHEAGVSDETGGDRERL